jgi:hypothetical protein
MAFTLVEPAREIFDNKSHKENFIEIKEKLFKESPLVKFILLNSMVWGASTLIALLPIIGYIGLGTRVVFIFFGPLMGYLMDNKGANGAFLLFAGIFAIFFIITMLPLLRLKNQFR